MGSSLAPAAVRRLALLTLAALLPAPAPAQAPAAPDTAGVAARVVGTVFDSVALAPLRGAAVRLVSAARPTEVPTGATTDSLGRFTLGALPAGRYLASFWHPRLDSLGLTPGHALVTVRDTGAVRLALATPPAPRVRAEYCGAAAGADSTGVLLGYLFGAADRAPREGGVVTARWLEVAVVRGRRGLSREVVERRAPADATGRFVLCGVPLGSDVTVSAARGADSSGTIPFRLPAGGVARRDLYVAAPRRAAVPLALAPADAAGGPDTVVVRRGDGRLAGVVRTTQGGPLRGVRLTVVGSDVAAITDDRGEFTLRGVPEGTQTLSARAVGYFPEDRAVDVFADSAAPVRLALASVRSVLDTIRVVGRRVRSTRLAAFEERRRSRPGSFLDSTRIERANLSSASDLIRIGSASMTIVPHFEPRLGRTVNLLRVRGGALCLPVVYLDGMPIRLREDLREMDTLLRPTDVQALELYTAGEAPAEFSVGGCATLVITTKW